MEEHDEMLEVSPALRLKQSRHDGHTQSTSSANSREATDKVNATNAINSIERIIVWNSDFETVRIF